MIKGYLHKILDKVNILSNKKACYKNFQPFDLQYVASSNYTTEATVSAYFQNVIVYRCVNLIANSASHVPWYIKKETAYI